MRERLPFQIPEFLRTIWASDDARAYWEPKIQAVSRAWPLVERATVERTLRPGALQSVAPEQMPELQQWSLRTGIPMVMVGMEGATGSYGNASIPYQAGAPFTYRVYFGRDPATFLEAWQDSDNIAIGAMLGFPSCCVAFFEKYWRKQGWRDLTVPAIGDSDAANLIRHTNVLLKPLGVRPVFHLPCSFLCQPTCELGEDILGLMPDLGYAQEAAWLEALLSMPMEWSSLHGVAMVVTPILKLVYASDPLPKKATFRLQSHAFPEHSARGKAFPFLTGQTVRLMRTTDLNGFTSLEAMRRAHQCVVDVLPGDLAGAVLDLGCGDGALLRTIQRRCSETTLYGVEQRADLIQKGLDETWVSDLFTWRWRGDYRLVLLALQRLVEVDRAAAARLLTAIADHAQQMLVYSYAGHVAYVDDLVLPRFTVVARGRLPSLMCEAILLEPIHDHDHPCTSDGSTARAGTFGGGEAAGEDGLQPVEAVAPRPSRD